MPSRFKGGAIAGPQTALQLFDGRACSSPDRALACGARGSKFDSCQAHQRAQSAAAQELHEAGLQCRRDPLLSGFFAGQLGFGGIGQEERLDECARHLAGVIHPT